MWLSILVNCCHGFDVVLFASSRRHKRTRSVGFGDEGAELKLRSLTDCRSTYLLRPMKSHNLGLAVYRIQS